MEDYEVLASEFDSVNISEYDPAIWSLESLVERDSVSYDIDEPIDPEVREEIERTDEEARRKAKNSDSVFYNGALVRLRDFEVNNGVLNIDLQNTNYSSHVGTRGRPELEKENRADPLSVGAYLRTSDEYVVLGERSGSVEIGGGEYQLAGAGFIEDPEEQYERSLNAEPSSPIHRELEEEVNLHWTQITGPRPSALIGANHVQPMLVYDTVTVLDSEEVAEEWAEIPESEREFSELIFLPEENPEAALDGEADILSTTDDSVEERRYEGELRPHAEGAFDTLL